MGYLGMSETSQPEQLQLPLTFEYPDHPHGSLKWARFWADYMGVPVEEYLERYIAELESEKEYVTNEPF